MHFQQDLWWHDVCFSKQTFLNTAYKKYTLLHFTLSENCSKVLDWQGFSLMKFYKCQNLNSLFCQTSFVELPKYSSNLQILSTVKKSRNSKILLRNSWKIGTPSGRQSWKICKPLASWHAKLKNWHSFGTLARLLARWHVKLRS